MTAKMFTVWSVRDPLSVMESCGLSQGLLQVAEVLFPQIHRWKAPVQSRFLWQSPAALQRSTTSLRFTHTPNAVMEGRTA